jgi:dinuclear metal center YbgI/SA1388 family protein
MLLKLLLDKINSCFPAETAMEGDRIGLQIETEASNVEGVLFTLEVTDEVVSECKQKNFNTIITFHPLIYSKLASISLDERVGRLCSFLIKNSINLISIHTTFDAYENGTSKVLADLLGLNVSSFLVQNEYKNNCGMGVIAVPKNKITTINLVSKINEICGSPVRYCGDNDTEIKKIAVVGGSGTSFIPDVIANKCDCFITADVTYHQFYAAQNHFTLIDVGHYEMEQFVPKAMENVLKNFLDSNKINYATSQVLTNPIQYYPKNNYLNIQNQNLK